MNAAQEEEPVELAFAAAATRLGRFLWYARQNAYNLPHADWMLGASPQTREIFVQHAAELLRKFAPQRGRVVGSITPESPWGQDNDEHRSPDGDGPVSSCIPADRTGEPRSRGAGSEPADALPALCVYCSQPVEDGADYHGLCRVDAERDV